MQVCRQVIEEVGKRQLKFFEVSGQIQIPAH
jgi:hypothetical protein